jgi:hypothetical protein
MLFLCSCNSKLSSSQDSEFAAEWRADRVNNRRVPESPKRPLSIRPDYTFSGWFVDGAGFFEGAGTWRRTNDAQRVRLVLSFTLKNGAQVAFKRDLYLLGKDTLIDQWHGPEEKVTYVR